MRARATLWGWLMLAGCSSRPMVTQPVVDTSATSAPLATVVKPTPKPDRPVRHDKLVVRHSLALGRERCLIDEGKLYCWGADSAGEWPTNNSPIREQIKPLTLPGIATSLAVSNGHSCATLQDGTVWCWGNNQDGELGAGLAADRSDIPVQVLAIDDALSVANGREHSCVIRRGGKVSCWGGNGDGQAGHTTGYTTQARRLVRPVELEGMLGAVDVTIGDSYACAVTDQGKVSCWGRFNGFGERPKLQDEVQLPRAIEVLNGATQLNTHGGYGCALLGAGEVQCWGYNYAGRLGHAETDGHAWMVPDQASARRVDELRGASQVAAGDAHACALVGGEVRCWGRHREGQLGRASPADAKTDGDYHALPVAGLRGVSEVAAGNSLSCARTLSHELFCWGARAWSPERSNSPTPEARRIH